MTRLLYTVCQVYCQLACKSGCQEISHKIIDQDGASPVPVSRQVTSLYSGARPQRSGERHRLERINSRMNTSSFGSRSYSFINSSSCESSSCCQTLRSTDINSLNCWREKPGIPRQSRSS